MYRLLALSFGLHDVHSSLLTPRERDVLHCLLSGQTDVEAAASLDVSPSTLRSYNKDIYHKFGVRNRRALLANWL